MANPGHNTIKMLDDTEHRRAVEIALEASGCELAELQAQAKRGSFTSDVARRAWFVVSALG